MKLLFVPFFLFQGLIILAQGDAKVKWSENYYSKITDKYDVVENNLICFGSIKWEINTVSLESLETISTINKISKSFEGIEYSFKNVGIGYYVDGKFGIKGSSSHKDKQTKSKILNSAFFPFKENYKGLEETPINIKKEIKQKGSAKSAKYLDSFIMFSGVTYSVYRRRTRSEKGVYVGKVPTLPLPYDIEIIAKNSDVKYFDCKAQNISPYIQFGRNYSQVYIPLERESSAYNEVHLNQEEQAIYFIFNHNYYLVQSWNSTENNIELFEGATNKKIAKLKLGNKERIAAFKVLDDGSIVLGGFEGESFEEDKTLYINNPMVKKKFNTIKINNVFRIILDNEGNEIVNKQNDFIISEVLNKYDNVFLNEIAISDNGEVFFPITEFNKTIKQENLSLIGITKTKTWAKEIPFFQVYPAVTTNISYTTTSHLGLHVLGCGDHLILAFNNNQENHTKFDFNSYTYDVENPPRKYTCSNAAGFTLLKVDGEGTIQDYFFETKTKKCSLSDVIKIDDKKLFLMLTGNKKTYLGTTTL